MKLISKHLERDRSGRVVLCPEDSEDMWHIYNLISPKDLLKATTFRRIQSTSTTGSVDSQRIRLTLSIAVESVDFDTQACSIRVNGQVAVENEWTKLGAYHCIDLELNRNLTLSKPEWDSFALGRIQDACDVSKKADIAAIVLQEGLANVCLITENMTIVRQRIEVTIPKKRKGSQSQFEKSSLRFHEQIYQAMLRHVDFSIVKVVILASPGFYKDSFYAYMNAEAIRTGNKMVQENRSKFLLMHSSTGHKHSLQEVLQDQSIQSRLFETKFARETMALNSFFNTLNDDPDRAYYGWDHVRKAGELGAISILLLTDGLFRSADIPTRRKYIALSDQVRSLGGAVHIFSTMHVSGEQLQNISGVAAILTFACPSVEEEIEAEQARAKEAASQQQ